MGTKLEILMSTGRYEWCTVLEEWLGIGKVKRLKALRNNGETIYAQFRMEEYCQHNPVDTASFMSGRGPGISL